MLPLSYSALADTAIVSTQTVDFSGSAVMAIDANSESIRASYIDGTMFRFWPGTSNKIAACITKPSLFRFRSGYKYRVRFRVAVADIGSKFTRLGVAFGIAGGDLFNLDPDAVDFDFTYSDNKRYGYYDVTTLCQADREYSNMALLVEFDTAPGLFNLWVSNFTVEQIDPGKEQANVVGDKIEDQTNQQKGFFEKLGDRIGGFFTDLFNNIMDGLKKLFIPDQEYIVQWAQDMQQFLKDHFGALYAPIDIVTRFINGFFSIDGSEDIAITFPAIEFGDVKLSDPVEFHFSEVTGLFGDLYTTYLYIADVIVIVGFILFCEKKLERILTK